MTKVVHLYASQRVSRRAKDGKDGAPGKDAYRVDVSPSTLVFDTNENGVVDGSALSGKYATVTVYKGSQKISTDNLSLPSNYATTKYTNVDGKIYNFNGEARIIIKKIEQETISGDEKVSKSSGQISFPIDVFGERSTLMWVTVNVQVNVAKFTGSVAFDNKGYKAQFDKLSKNAATKDELTQATSKFEQTAREISLSVSEKSIGRRNMLVGSACRKYGDGFMYMSGSESSYYDGYPLEQIEKNSGIDGVNCIHCRTKQKGTDIYFLSGFRWHGISPQGNIKLERGKNYVLSFYAKTNTPNDIYFAAEVLYQGSKIDTSRPAGYAGPTGYSTTFSASEADKWELFTVKVSVPSDAPYEYVEINIFARARVYSFVGGYICKPMLEEGENYNGWTLSEQDYDYVGGNLLDNARTLDKSGTLAIINDTVIQNGYGTDSACIKNLMQANATLSDYKEVLRWIFGSTYLVNGNDYIFSFVAKADVDDARVVCYMWSGDIEKSCDIFTEGNGGAWDSQSDGNVVFILSRQWTRYWVHWRPKDGYATPKEVIIRHTGNNSTSASTVYVTQPKLEIGATMTEFTERKTDLVDKTTMKKAGIEITTNQIKLYGDKVQVLTRKDGNSEYVEAGLFVNGKLNANLIDAETINVNHVYARSSEGASVIGHFGNFDKADAVVGNDKCPLWLGAALAKDAPFRVTKDGSLYASKGIFAGELKGVTGSFHRLTAVSSDGNKSAGSIYFDGSGRITFDADIYNQGYNSAAKRGLRFYASSVWCRSAFGHQQSTLAVINGGSMRVYPDGYDSGYTVKALEHTTYDNKTVYKIPLYSPNDESAGCPIDVVVFCSDRAIATNYYEFIPGGTGKRWMAINANDKNNGVYFSDVGGWHQLTGGQTINLVYIHPEILTPSQNDKTYFGRGIFWSGENDLNWTDR